MFGRRMFSRVRESSWLMQWYTTLCCCLGTGVTMASTIALNSLLVSSLQSDPDINLTFEEASWIAPTWATSGMLGCLVGGWLSDLLGRRTVLLLSTLPFLAGLVVLGLSSDLAMVLLSRALQGLGDGLMYPNVLVYIAEISSKELRGTLCNVLNICFCLGLCFTFSLALLVQWRTLVWLLISPILLSLVGLSQLPETPHWLAQKNRLEEAERTLERLRSHNQTEEEVEELRQYRGVKLESFREKIADRLRVLTSRAFLKPFMIAEPLNILYSCSGLSMMTFYIVTIFEESGTSVDKHLASLTVSAFRLFISFLSSAALLKLPRRPLFLCTTLLVCLSMFCLGLFSFLRTRPGYEEYLEQFSWAPLLIVIMMFAGGQLGFNPIIKIIISEIFPTELRSTGTSFILITSMVCMAAFSKLFSNFVSWFGFHGTFWLYSAVQFCCFVFGYFAMPEYAGVSLVQIEKTFDNKK